MKLLITISWIKSYWLFLKGTLEKDLKRGCFLIQEVPSSFLSTQFIVAFR